MKGGPRVQAHRRHTVTAAMSAQSSAILSGVTVVHMWYHTDTVYCYSLLAIHGCASCHLDANAAADTMLYTLFTGLQLVA